MADAFAKTAPPNALSRRGFLRQTAGGAAAIGVAAWLPAGCAADYPQASTEGIALTALTPKEYAVVRAAAEALLVDVPVAPAVVAGRIEAELAVAGEPMRTDMKTVLGLMEHLTFLGGRARRFTALSPDARRSNLAGWSRSRFALRRGAYQAVRGFVDYFAWIDDATRPLTGFQGPWPERARIPVHPVDFGEVV
jgi:hypothetical protein